MQNMQCNEMTTHNSTVKEALFKSEKSFSRCKWQLLHFSSVFALYSKAVVVTGNSELKSDKMKQTCPTPPTNHIRNKTYQKNERKEKHGCSFIDVNDCDCDWTANSIRSDQWGLNLLLVLGGDLYICFDTFWGDTFVWSLQFVFQIYFGSQQPSINSLSNTF